MSIILHNKIETVNAVENWDISPISDVFKELNFVKCAWG